MAIREGHKGPRRGTTQMIRSRTVPAGEFKNSCLKLMEAVRKDGVPITVTKRGKPLVRIVPIAEEGGPDTLVGTIVHEADDIFSTGESWEADA
jgi:prevent-host-death family protein